MPLSWNEIKNKALDQAMGYQRVTSLLSTDKPKRKRHVAPRHPEGI